MRHYEILTKSAYVMKIREKNTNCYWNFLISLLYNICYKKCWQQVRVTHQQSGFWLAIRLGLVPDPAKNPTRFVFGSVVIRGGTAQQVDFTVPSALDQLWPQLSIWVLIVSWHDQYANRAVLSAHSPPGFRFAIRPILVELLWNNAKYDAKIPGFRSQLNEYRSDRIFESGRWKSA